MTSFDPLDREILERALHAVYAALEDEFDSDERLEAALRRELIEIASSNGISDPETLRDLVLASLSR
jgi:hypothetical protein